MLDSLCNLVKSMKLMNKIFLIIFQGLLIMGMLWRMKVIILHLVGEVNLILGLKVIKCMLLKKIKESEKIIIIINNIANLLLFYYCYYIS